METPVLTKGEILLRCNELHQPILFLLQQSDVQKDMGNLETANALYQQLIATLEQLLALELHNNSYYPDSPFDLSPTINSLLNAMLTQADVIEALGELEKAEKLREEAMALSKKYLPESLRRERERQYSAALIKQGRFNEALVLLTAARDQFFLEGDLLNMASVTTNIANMFEWLGDYQRSAREVQKALKMIMPLFTTHEPASEALLSPTSKDDFQLIEARAKLWSISLELRQIEARSNRYLGNLKEAEQQFRKILPDISPAFQPGIEVQLAAIAIESMHYQEGLENINRLEPLFKGLFLPKYGVLLKFKAEALLGLDKPLEALKVLDEAIRQLSKYADSDSLWKVQWFRAKALKKLDRPKEALTAYDETIQTVNNLRKASVGYRLDSTYLKNKLPVFCEAISLSAVSGEAEICCRFIELIKSRILTAILSTSTNTEKNNTGTLEEQLDALSGEIDALEYTAYQNGWTAEIKQKRTFLLSERAELIERIRFSDPRWRAMTMPIPFDLEHILDLLASHEQAALTLFFQANELTVVLLKDKQCLVTVKQLNEETSRLLARYQQNLQASRAEHPLYDPLSLGLEVEHLLPAELLLLALQTRSLIIVPHGFFHLLPWAGMLFKGKRLFEYCPVSILPNLSCLSILKTGFPASSHVALIGAPDYSGLSGLQPIDLALEELRTIEDIYSPGSLVGPVLSGKAATEEGFWTLAGHKDSEGNILHIACHGDFITGDPMNSGLLLADAKVDATEIARSTLKYNEVILSACSTGYRPLEVQGITLSGDDILGLPGAFLEAGIRSILVSIPKTRDDVTLRFMTIYHEHRTEGKTPMIALQETQKKMLSDAMYSPYLWLGFTVYGCH